MRSKYKALSSQRVRASTSTRERSKYKALSLNTQNIRKKLPWPCVPLVTETGGLLGLAGPGPTFRLNENPWEGWQKVTGQRPRSPPLAFRHAHGHTHTSHAQFKCNQRRLSHNENLKLSILSIKRLILQGKFRDEDTNTF